MKRYLLWIAAVFLFLLSMENSTWAADSGVPEIPADAAPALLASTVGLVFLLRKYLRR